MRKSRREPWNSPRQDHGEDASYWIGRAYLNLGDLDKALTNLLTAQARQAASAEVAFYLHRSADRLSARALEAYAAQRPDSYRTHQLRAEYLNASGDHERAIAEYRKALAIEPGAALLHLEIGKIRLGQREYDEAIAAFDAELAVDAYSVEALTRAGEAYYLSSRPDLAMKYLERALSVNPRAAAAHKVIGQVFSSGGISPGRSSTCDPLWIWGFGTMGPCTTSSAGRSASWAIVREQRSTWQ